MTEQPFKLANPDYKRERPSPEAKAAADAYVAALAAKHGVDPYPAFQGQKKPIMREGRPGGDESQEYVQL